VKFTYWVIYDHPSDYPDHAVARWWVGTRPTTRVLLAPTVEAVRTMVREATPDKVCFTRAEHDDPMIVEVWL